MRITETIFGFAPFHISPLSFTRISCLVPQSHNDLLFQQLYGPHYLQKQTFCSWLSSDYFNILFILSLHCNPNKHIQAYDEERSYQTNGSKVTSSSWWPSESLFSRAAWWGEHFSDVIHWNRNSKYSCFLNNVILPWQHIITGFVLFIFQVRKERWTIYHSWIPDFNVDINQNSISIEYIFWILYTHTHAVALRHKG